MKLNLNAAELNSLMQVSAFISILFGFVTGFLIAYIWYNPKSWIQHMEVLTGAVEYTLKAIVLACAFTLLIPCLIAFHKSTKLAKLL